MEANPIEFARMVNLKNEVTDTRTLGNPKSPQTTLRNGQHGSEIKAVLKRSSDLKKSKPVDGGNVSVEVGTHCAEGVQQLNMFGTPDRYKEKSIDSVIRYICPLEGTEQVNVPVSPESKLIGSPTTQKRNDVGVTDQNEAPSVRYRPVLWQQNKRSTPVSRMRLTSSTCVPVIPKMILVSTWNTSERHSTKPGRARRSVWRL